MTLKQLEYLVKIMECGSMNQAAAQLDVSQPNLTKAVSSLETEYGFQILIRKTRGVEFTQRGRDFVQFARGVLSAAEAFPRTGSDSVDKARLLVASHQLDFVYPALLDVCQLYPNSSLFFDLVETDRASAAELVLQGLADMGFAVRTSVDTRDMLWFRETSRLDIHTIDEASSCLAVGPGSPLWTRSSVQADEITSCLHVAVDLEQQAKISCGYTQSQYRSYNNDRIIFVNTISACQYLLLHSEAVSFCSKWTKGCFTSPDIHFIPVQGFDSQSKLILIRRKEEAMTVQEAQMAAAVYRRLNKNVPEWIQCRLPNKSTSPICQEVP